MIARRARRSRERSRAASWVASGRGSPHSPPPPIALAPPSAALLPGGSLFGVTHERNRIRARMASAGAPPSADDVVLYSVRRRVDAWLVGVLLLVVFVAFAFIVPSDEVRPMAYAERLYLATVVAAGGLLVAGYTVTVADARVALNAALFYAIFCAGVVPRHAYLVSLDGAARLAVPLFPLYLGVAVLAYVLLCIVQRRFPGDVIVFGSDPVLNYHHAMDLLYALWATPAFRGASNYAPEYAPRGPYRGAGPARRVAYYDDAPPSYDDHDDDDVAVDDARAQPAGRTRRRHSVGSSYPE